jgi:hypothetical protein
MSVAVLERRAPRWRLITIATTRGECRHMALVTEGAPPPAKTLCGSPIDRRRTYTLGQKGRGSWRRPERSGTIALPDCANCAWRMRERSVAA